MLIIGEGRSALETLIALADHRHEHEDASPIHWSFRGSRIPFVPKDLSGAFYNTTMVRSQIQCHPNSEPDCVIQHQNQAFVSLRVATTMQVGMGQSQNLLFPTAQCLGCFEAEPLSPLIQALTPGLDEANRLLLTHDMETSQAGIFAGGTLLGSGYHQMISSKDPQPVQKVERANHLVQSLSDGVVLADTVAERVRGKKTRKADSQDLAELHSLNHRGGKVTSYPLQAPRITLGRASCDLNFPEDEILADHHATITRTDSGYLLRDENSPTGIFMRIPSATWQRVAKGGLIRVGQQFLLLGENERHFQIQHYNAKGEEAGNYELGEQALILGSGPHHVSLDSRDMALSRRHLAVRVKGRELWVKDLKSVNGSYLRLLRDWHLVNGDVFQMGLTQLVFHDANGPSFKDPIQQSESMELKTLKSGQPSVTFQNMGGPFPAKPGQTIREVAEINGIQLNVECRKGVCGSDPVRILEGEDYLQMPISDLEADTLQQLCDLEPGPCRMACTARVNGPVIVEIL